MALAVPPWELIEAELRAQGLDPERVVSEAAESLRAWETATAVSHRPRLAGPHVHPIGTIEP